MGQRIIHLVRHGFAAYANTEPKDWDGYLTELGHQQAHLTAKRLAQLPISAIYHSTAGRASETAKILATPFPDIPLHPTPLLRECTPCLPTREFSIDITPEQLQNYKAQAEQAFSQFFQPTDADTSKRHDLLVCHGNIICYFVCRALQVPPESWGNTTIYNCGISEVLIQETGEMWLVSHNDTGHLPYELRTFL